MKTRMNQPQLFWVVKPQICWSSVWNGMNDKMKPLHHHCYSSRGSEIWQLARDTKTWSSWHYHHIFSSLTLQPMTIILSCHASIYHNDVIIFHICDRIREKGSLRTKRDFLPFFKLSPFQGLRSPRSLTWFIGSLGLLHHRSNVRS